ncbi:type II toxin-antitoxin system HipA family toxin [Pandoraea thiooxydans]|uniref:type II toxin-antitoxin system HipA family toxin n=1 Tax=Pandoraea thiooxydans TaxID=445709 RepID=UPI00214F78D4|nr:type II toxin-antitoxin system HipA family toxin [Pandoraea thiooxydans]
MELVRGRRILFSYDDAWLSHPEAFALSPDMPLRAGVIEPPAGLDVHPIFDDAGPDRWGHAIIDKVFNPQRRSPLEYLELTGEDRVGALGFSRSGIEYLSVQDQAFHATDLAALMDAARALEKHLAIDAAMGRLLRPGTSAGGARPKAVITHEGQAWIAKFPAEGDQVDVCAIEHASLQLAQRCGIRVPESALVEVGGRRVLLVKRFDRENGARLHFASARTMLIAEGIKDGEMGYGDIADVARRLSSDPVQDCHEIFRRMALNVCLENTDDHERNHAFLFTQGAWALAPAYDIQPQMLGIGYQQLRVGAEGYAPTLSNVLSESRRFLLKESEAKKMLDAVVKQAREWKSCFVAAGVSVRDVEVCEGFVMRVGS